MKFVLDSGYECILQATRPDVPLNEKPLSLAYGALDPGLKPRGRDHSGNVGYNIPPSCEEDGTVDGLAVETLERDESEDYEEAADNGYRRHDPFDDLDGALFRHLKSGNTLDGSDCGGNIRVRDLAREERDVCGYPGNGGREVKVRDLATEEAETNSWDGGSGEVDQEEEGDNDCKHIRCWRYHSGGSVLSQCAGRCCTTYKGVNAARQPAGQMCVPSRQQLSWIV